MVVVRAFDPELLAKAILDLAASPHARASIGEMGRARVESRFLMRETAAEAVRLLGHIVVGDRGSRY
jgi:hypothetical protein